MAYTRKKKKILIKWDCNFIYLEDKQLLSKKLQKYADVGGCGGFVRTVVISCKTAESKFIFGYSAVYF